MIKVTKVWSPFPKDSRNVATAMRLGFFRVSIWMGDVLI